MNNMRKYFDIVQKYLDLIEKTGVICTPGISFGPLGEGYVRFALVLPPEKIAEAIEAVRTSGLV